MPNTAAIRAAVEKHCHIDIRWPASARIDDSHMDAFIADLVAALAADKEPTEDEQIVDRLNYLRGGEGDSVTILCDNPDFNGQPERIVECCGDWTGWEDRRYGGDTLLGALNAAWLECMQWRTALQYGREKHSAPLIGADTREPTPGPWKVGRGPNKEVEIWGRMSFNASPILATMESQPREANAQLIVDSVNAYRRGASSLTEGDGAWRSISTAPNDGPAFLVWVPENRCIYEVLARDGNLSIFGGGFRDNLWRATHWMPLPTPPSVASTDRGSAA